MHTICSVQRFYPVAGMTSEKAGITSAYTKPLNEHCGFTLVECLVATVLFTISCLGIFSLYQQQLLATQSLLRWHDADEVASAKALDLQAQVLESFNGIADIAADNGGKLAAGTTVIAGNSGSVTLQRHWQITKEKDAPQPLKLATVSVTFASNGVDAKIEHRVILWRPGEAPLPHTESLNSPYRE